MANVEIPIPAVRNTGNSHLPAYQSPHLIATYSHIADRSIVHNDASMSYYKGAHVGDDLKAGYGNFVERDPLLEEHLDGLCEALLRFRQNGGRMKSGAIVTFRGMLTRYVRQCCFCCQPKVSCRLNAGACIQAAGCCFYGPGLLGNECPCI